MIKTVAQLFEEAVEEWRLARGVGTMIVPKSFNSKAMVLAILQRMYAKKNNLRTLIVTNTWEERLGIVNLLNHGGDEENDKEFHDLLVSNRITVITSRIFENYLTVRFDLFIGYNTNEFDSKRLYFIKLIKFKLLLLDHLVAGAEERAAYYAVAPLLNCFKDNEVNELRANTPVEEELVGVDLIPNTEEYNDLQRYNEYITTSFNIFGDFDTIKEVRRGNDYANVSAQQVALQIAEQNGWNDHLDMSIEVNAQIDALYNPISLRDRAETTYNVIRKRTNLLTDYKEKLKYVTQIINEHLYDKILVISKRGEFASQITAHINDATDAVCADYHSKMLPVDMVDHNGNPVLYKSGINKGKKRTLGAQGQRTRNEQDFNNNLVNVLSANNAPDNHLSVSIDCVIITSPMCESIENLIYRLYRTHFNQPLKLYTLYIKGTQEEKILLSRNLGSNHKVLNEIKNNAFIDKNIDFPIVD